LNGAASTARTSISIPAGGQFTGFLRQIPGFESLPSPLQGILRVSAGGDSTLAAAVLRARYNEPGDLLFSGMPMIPDAPPPARLRSTVAAQSPVDSQ